MFDLRENKEYTVLFLNQNNHGLFGYLHKSTLEIKFFKGERRICLFLTFRID